MRLHVPDHPSGEKPFSSERLSALNILLAQFVGWVEPLRNPSLSCSGSVLAVVIRLQVTPKREWRPIGYVF
ncbi:hypothetical protein [Bradyrhizobium sp. RP6]|uniref:hypothetical protein n=1 Tax=Bradyrhizobium sp. RP6 TaxID=2489596 RepID=UPI000F5377C1|nr:hypothetical protein [Bradyrhizobium sp. RP6]RQH06666.1 hypothetical protein EHH60_30305 [Bradyrhizobium sp. RP6]